MSIRFLNSGSSVDSNIKLFSTIDEMNQSTGNKEGDLAVVYRTELRNMSVDNNPLEIHFNDVVTLPEVYNGSTMMEDYNMDISIYLTSTRFEFENRNGSTITYTSDDGVTYTKTSEENLVTFDKAHTMEWREKESWVNEFGYFMQVNGNVFEGLYNYKEDVSLNYIAGFKNVTGLSKYDIAKIPIKDINKICEIVESNLPSGINKLNVDTSHAMHLFLRKIDNMYEVYMGVYKSSSYDDLMSNSFGVLLDTDAYIAVETDSSEAYKIVDTEPNATSYPNIRAYKYEINADDNYSFTLNDCKSSEFTNKTIKKNIGGSISTYNKPCISTPVNSTDELLCIHKYSNRTVYNLAMVTIENLHSSKQSPDIMELQWIIADTQLNAIDEHVYNDIYYGKNGVGNGTIGIDISLYADDINAEIYNKIKNFYNNAEPAVIEEGWKPLKDILFIPAKEDSTPLWDTSSVINMYGMFKECNNLQTIPLLDTSSATSMSEMFRECKNLQTIPLLNTSSVTNMSYMFYYCNNLQEIPLLNTSSVTSMRAMFQNCANLKDIPLFDTSEVISLDSTFAGCALLQTIPLFNTPVNTSLYRTFQDCTSLTEIPLLDTSKVTNTNGAFDNCSLLVTIPELDTSSAGDMMFMFSGCTSLQNLPLLDTSSATNMRNMFQNCSNLSEDSLNNILQMCINAKILNTYGNNTLKYLGLSQSQATKCRSLSNYQAFTEAGWSTGY